MSGKDKRIDELEAALQDMTQRRDYLKTMNKELIEENERLRGLIRRTSRELIELAIDDKL